MRERRRLFTIIATAVACLGAVATAVCSPRPRLIWNASASAPIGLYYVMPGAPVRVGDMVVARLPRGLVALAAHRRYLPSNVPLVKRVAAGPGARLCAIGHLVLIDGKVAASRRDVDRAGRPLPAWHGCRTLARGDMFLLMAGVPDSFDGRYFGVTGRRDLIGKATPLWVY